jgi:NADH:ubiquinone oxidoreductase subunit F (NADH-binding)/(2Fe-2S) ferredoxin
LGAGAGSTIQAIREFLDTRSIPCTIVEVGCIGLCAVEPIVDIMLPGRARVSFAGVTHDRVCALLESMLERGEVPEDMALCQFTGTGETWKGVPLFSEHPFFGPQTRWVLENCGTMNPESLEEYLAAGGYRAFAVTLRTRTPESTCDIVEESGLRGRGGGGFPAGRKWRFALNTPSGSKYVICNADEGDPGAFMDRAVIEGDPHKLIEGIAIASYAVGANKAYIYIRAEYPLAIQRLRKALEQAENQGILGTNIFDSGFDLNIVIKMGAGAFVCGEETALIHSIEGHRGMPSPKPPFPAVSGLFGKPTVINNVETLANVPGILNNGPGWFRSAGTENSPGTKVFALSGKITNTGLIEVAMGTPIHDILFSMGGGIPDGKAFKAVQIGGPSGGCIPDGHTDLRIDYESLGEFGAMMGSGGLVVMDEDTCMVDVAKFFMDFIQRESCGKCIPCREGTRRLLEILNAITRGYRDETPEQALERFRGIVNLERLGQVIRKTSLCGLGQTAPNPVLSTLRWFRDEYEAHIFERKCPAGVCTGLLTFSIDEDACRGCTLCAGKCPTGAVKGARKSPHYIVTSECIGCGACLEVCPFDAVRVH